MQRLVLTALVLSAIGAVPAIADPLPLYPAKSDPRAFAAASPSREAPYAVSRQPNLGGGFIEFLLGGADRPGAPQFPGRAADPLAGQDRSDPLARPLLARTQPADLVQPERMVMDPRYRRQVVDYDGKEKPGTVIIDTTERFLYMIQDGGRALRYGIGVGRPGFAWAGIKQISAKREWPDWTPPDEMLKRRPDLPRFMPGGPENPLGARAMYLGSSLYRIHGSNEPWTIGTAVSSGCIRMRNEDVIDLYERVRVGTRVVVI